MTLQPLFAALQGVLSMGSSRQEYWNGLPFPSPGDLPYLGIESTSPALAGRFFTSEPPRKLSNHDAIHLKRIQYYMSIISQSLGKRNSGIILN